MEGEVFTENLVGAKTPPEPKIVAHRSTKAPTTAQSPVHNIPPRKPWEQVQFDSSLKPKSYEIKGTPKDSVILILDVNILDSTGALPYKGDVLIEGERLKYVGQVPAIEDLIKNPKVKILKGRGRTLMSGLGDSHVHLSWNSGDIPALGGLGVEEHTLLTARSAKIAIDSGYTMAFGAASAQDRLDVVIRDAINAGKLPGPRYLANCREIVRSQDAVGQGGLARIADGPDEMREAVNRHIDIGADQIKLTMSGEEICQPLSSEMCYYTDEETAACVEVAHGRGRRLCAHARARDSVKMCVKHGVDIIFHASWTDGEGMEMLEKNKHKHMVSPALNWLYATLYESESYGYKMSAEERDGYERELAIAKKTLSEMHRRGITVLPRRLRIRMDASWNLRSGPRTFCQLVSFTPMESILSATAGVAKLFMREDELGQVQPGFFADCLLVDGNPLDDISILQDHERLNMIVINGRIHKSSQEDFMTTSERQQRAATVAMQQPQINHDSNGVNGVVARLTNYVAYQGSDQQTRIGHLDLDSQEITPLTMASGALIESLYELIELKQDPVVAGSPFPLSSVTLLPPISGRDILCVGKNYVAHSEEFHKSGFDSSDKVALPSHPVIFTKRSTSIIASGENIVWHPKFTRTLDYEGEIGVILGKSGFNISEKDAMSYVWGYTIINDVTAREVQRDHKQFFLGKSGDTYCPIGPIAVPKESLPHQLQVQTFVNGVKRQEATTGDLIFSVALLIATISAGATIRAGDVIATGTPAGVGFGQSPPTYLKPGDVVDVTVTGLGTLRNQIVEATRESDSSFQPKSPRPSSIVRTPGHSGLTQIGSKQVHVEVSGHGAKNAVFVHGLGGSTEFYGPLLSSASTGLEEDYTCYRYDLEGHGLTPTAKQSITSIESYTEDLLELFSHYGIKSATLFAHSMGSLPALLFATRHAQYVEKIILLGPARYPVPAAAAESQAKRAAAVRAGGMKAVAATVAANGTSETTKEKNPGALAAVRAILLGQDPEGYAKACSALSCAAALEIEMSKLAVPVLIIASSDDKVSPMATCESLASKLSSSSKVELKVVHHVGHWSAIEDPGSVGKLIRDFVDKKKE
ncbi:hypothetical protein CLAIMM_11468 [Cladophialophora immunda]|nr:hypothetical protein CLAIMM_11468 [Cladophialophora immunda]